MDFCVVRYRLHLNQRPRACHQYQLLPSGFACRVQPKFHYAVTVTPATSWQHPHNKIRGSPCNFDVSPRDNSAMCQSLLESRAVQFICDQNDANGFVEDLSRSLSNHMRRFKTAKLFRSILVSWSASATFPWQARDIPWHSSHGWIREVGLMEFGLFSTRRPQTRRSLGRCIDLNTAAGCAQQTLMSILWLARSVALP